jgi:hypothetical protein
MSKGKHDDRGRANAEEDEDNIPGYLILPGLLK